MKYSIDHELVIQVLTYIEDARMIIEEDYGKSKCLSQLIEDNDMPLVYYKLLKLIDNKKALSLEDALQNWLFRLEKLRLIYENKNEKAERKMKASHLHFILQYRIMRLRNEIERVRLDNLKEYKKGGVIY